MMGISVFGCGRCVTSCLRREESGVFIVRESLGTNWGAKGHICPSKTACRGLGIRCAAVGHDGTLATVISAV